jgi:hypothetical protein
VTESEHPAVRRLRRSTPPCRLGAAHGPASTALTETQTHPFCVREPNPDDHIASRLLQALGSAQPLLAESIGRRQRATMVTPQGRRLPRRSFSVLRTAARRRIQMRVRLDRLCPDPDIWQREVLPAGSSRGDVAESASPKRYYPGRSVDARLERPDFGSPPSNLRRIPSQLLADGCLWISRPWVPYHPDHE